MRKGGEGGWEARQEYRDTMQKLEYGVDGDPDDQCRMQGAALLQMLLALL